MKALYIYGAGGHGKVLSDIANLKGYDEIIFLDDEDPMHPSLSDIGASKDIPIAIGIASNQRRKVIYKKLKSMGLKIVTLIHPSATISPSVKIGRGCVIMAGVIINADSHIKKGVILNSGCIVEHECIVEEFAHISPKVALARKVHIETLVHVGIGTNVIQNVSIGRDSIIGAGSVVVSDILPNSIAYGVPCKTQKHLN